MISVIYDNEEYTPPYHTHTVGDFIARCYIKLGLYDEAVKWIWKDYEHLCKNAKHYNKKERVETPLRTYLGVLWRVTGCKGTNELS